MSRARSLASVFVPALALAIAPWLVGCATGAGSTTPATAAEQPTAAEPVAAAAPAAAAAVPPTSYEPCKILDPPCSKLPGGCQNTPYFPTDCLTTQYGAARGGRRRRGHQPADCNGGNYALCFASGPPYATGTPTPATSRCPASSATTLGGELRSAEVYTTRRLVRRHQQHPQPRRLLPGGGGVRPRRPQVPEPPRLRRGRHGVEVRRAQGALRPSAPTSRTRPRTTSRYRCCPRRTSSPPSASR